MTGSDTKLRRFDGVSAGGKAQNLSTEVEICVGISGGCCVVAVVKDCYGSKLKK